MYVPVWLLLILVLLALLGIFSSLGLHFLSQILPDQERRQ